jgi:hypothetical protein
MALVLARIFGRCALRGGWSRRGDAPECRAEIAPITGHVVAVRRTPVKPALGPRFEGPYEGSWIEGQSQRWRQEPHRQSKPGAARKGKSMYIGIGTIVIIIIIVLVILMLRRR